MVVRVTTTFMRWLSTTPATKHTSRPRIQFQHPTTVDKCDCMQESAIEVRVVQQRCRQVALLHLLKRAEFRLLDLLYGFCADSIFHVGL